ncbi:glycosyl transferase group 1 [Gloeothece citriformis PCC 7424]|uniref:Glycosyl transferase group 1 n=1 Tax=Gloeothece citriformis (strain PCC 7424) TaxID=65393 RepID=B7KDC1_GLOC7|nr:glycosyltransferase family 1 protein [Gloeothece citriformis]ACK68941.1 glycosyl transferase group 1 [Gloeothece citriformis PCC 7424]
MNQVLINLSVIFNKPTGISNYILNVLPYLKPLNPILLTASSREGFKTYTIPENLSPEQGIKGHFNRLLWTQFKLGKIYQDLKGSLLFSPLPEAPLFQNYPFVVMVHDLIPLRFPNPYSPLTPYFRYYIPQVLRQADHIICNSQATAKDIQDFLGISAQKITPIPLAYDDHHFRPLSLPQPEHPYFIYLGRSNPHKNLPRLISAFAKLPNCKEYQLWLAGPKDPRYIPKLESQVKELELIDRVKFLDYVSYDQLPVILNQALALVFPSLWEGFGLPVLEAMGCGVPVITSNLSSLPEVTSDAAILINPYHTEEITAAMAAIARDSQLRSHLRSLSLQRAQTFSWAKTGQATLEILKHYANCL